MILTFSWSNTRYRSSSAFCRCGHGLDTALTTLRTCLKTNQDVFPSFFSFSMMACGWEDAIVVASLGGSSICKISPNDSGCCSISSFPAILNPSCKRENADAVPGRFFLVFSKGSFGLLRLRSSIGDSDLAL
jgi:hypothetical protein